MNALAVYLHDGRVGTLERLPQARLRFTYSEEAIASDSGQLSLGLPIRPEPFGDEDARPFFGGLLPEGEFLRAVSRAFGVSATNPFAVLEAIGGECAGAVSLAPPGQGPPAQHPPRWMSPQELHELITELPTRPLLTGEGEAGLRLSLAGAQDKLPVVFGGGRIGITRGSPPSTHIIKLPDSRFAEMTANEAFCTALGRVMGLPTVAATARIAASGDSFEGAADNREYLLVRRYDREERGTTRRVHQEDFCQALGVVSEAKYESDGGPGVAACAQLLRRHSAVPAIDVPAFLDALLFNFLIGNHDAHAKNYSVLLEGDRAPRTAPLYDLISTTAYEGLSRKLAMRMGGEYRPDYIRGRHLARLADSVDMGLPAIRRQALAATAAAVSSLDQAREAMPTEFQDRPIIERVGAIVRKRAKLLREAAGER